MFVELAAECLEHGHEGRHMGQMVSSLIVAAGVLGASHRWLECGKMCVGRFFATLKIIDPRTPLGTQAEIRIPRKSRY